MVVPLDRYQLLVEWMVDNKIEFSSSLRVKADAAGCDVKRYFTDTEF
jgi:hypothetical protein